MQIQSKACRFKNFGRNVEFVPKDCYQPQTEEQVLEILRSAGGRKIRVVGSLHSWSEIAVGHDIVIDLEDLNQVRLIQDASGTTAEIGAGCTIDDALKVLREHGQMLPTVGMIGEQRIAGAISTATHGSGAASLSHFVTGLRVASFDHSGNPTISDLTSGAELHAARCALGRMGVILSVRIPCIPMPLVYEQTKSYKKLHDALTGSQSYPLTQFYLMPWSWVWITARRRFETSPRSPLLRRTRYRVLRWFSGFLVNALTIAVVRWIKRPSLVPPLYHALAKAAASNPVINRMDIVLMMKGPRRYVEMETFVPAESLAPAVEIIRNLLEYLSGQSESLNADTLRHVQAIGATAELDAQRGKYVHHYPITVRFVHQDDTLISMSSEGAMYAISFVSIDRKTESFVSASRILAAVLAEAFGARPHWGKILPLDNSVLKKQMPQLAEFERQCSQADPNRTFSNAFTHDKLGF